MPPLEIDWTDHDKIDAYNNYTPKPYFPSYIFAQNACRNCVSDRVLCGKSEYRVAFA